MKRREPKSFAEIFDECMSRAGASDSMARHRACYLWPEIVGPGVNRYTYQRRLEGSVLHVYITSAPLKNELSYHRQHLLRKLNEMVGTEALTDIVFH